MVIVTNEPSPETEPMLGPGSHEEIVDTAKIRRNSYADEAYKSITSSMKADPLNITSSKTALELLSTAARLQNMPLVKQCIENLDQQLDKTNVLAIFSHLSKIKMPNMNKNDFEPSAPPIVEFEDQIGSNWVQELTDSLKHNCLLEIDRNADFLLKQKDILELSYPDILSICERDTLQVSNELLVYGAVSRWSVAECHRRTLTTHPLNIKAVLRDLCYVPRYGLMNKREFKEPQKSGILDEKEWRLIKFYIEEKRKNRAVQELPHKASKPRIIGDDKPKILSSRSATRGDTIVLRDSCPRKTTCERCLINFLTCWTAVFD